MTCSVFAIYDRSVCSVDRNHALNVQSAMKISCATLNDNTMNNHDKICSYDVVR